MENRIISSPHALDHFRQSCKPVPEAASRYSCPDPLLGLQLPQIGPDPALDAFRNGNNSATLEFADTSFPSVSLARFHREQDAWNSLQVTGLPRNLKPSPGRQLHHVPKTSTGMDDSHARFSRHDPSETDSQVTHSDSGYGSRRGDSEISSLYPVEPISSPGTIVSSYNCNRFDTGSSGDNRPVYNASSFGTAAINFQSRYPQEIRCSYPDCSWTGKCPSDKKCVIRRNKRNNLYKIRSLADTAQENTRQDIRSNGFVMNQTALARRVSGQSTTWNGTRNACTGRFPAEDPRRCTCALAGTAGGVRKSGPVMTISASTSAVRIQRRVKRSC